MKSKDGILHFTKGFSLDFYVMGRYGEVPVK
jgi:hypothetical protein